MPLLSFLLYETLIQCSYCLRGRITLATFQTLNHVAGIKFSGCVIWFIVQRAKDSGSRELFTSCCETWPLYFILYCCRYVYVKGCYSVNAGMFVARLLCAQWESRCMSEKDTGGHQMGSRRKTYFFFLVGLYLNPPTTYYQPTQYAFCCTSSLQLFMVIYRMKNMDFHDLHKIEPFYKLLIIILLFVNYLKELDSLLFLTWVLHKMQHNWEHILPVGSVIFSLFSLCHKTYWLMEVLFMLSCSEEIFVGLAVIHNWSCLAFPAVVSAWREVSPISLPF